MVNETNRQRRPPRREFRENSRQRNYRRRNMNNRNESLKPPSDINLPFFAYGIFKPGQLAYSKIEQYVEKYEKSQIDHIMLIRDGVPIITKKPHNYSKTYGYIIYFKEEYKEKAYKVISDTKSSALYKWNTEDLDNKQVNVLFGVKPKLGSSVPEYDEENFDGKNDPFFKEAIELIEENLKLISSDHLDVKEFFELQMNYMLLWSAIDRYTSLKYNEKSKGKNNKEFANEKAFKKGLKKYVIVGVGESERSKNSGVTPLHLALEAARKALADAGLEAKEIDGFMSYSRFFCSTGDRKSICICI